MKVTRTAIPEVLILEPKVFGDARGFFSGERPWQEGDTTAPLNVYGATKLEGEQLIVQHCAPT